jgi:hypothetical protein
MLKSIFDLNFGIIVVQKGTTGAHLVVKKDFTYEALCDPPDQP